MSHAEMIQHILSGSITHASKLITMIENRHEKAIHIMKRLFPYTGRAYVIGITGSPGVGKSALIGEITRILREKNNEIGIIAVDPSSSFSGGAVLGDRMRLEKGKLDQKVFIRSMATRGKLGGLTPAVQDAVVVMDAMGKDIIVIETVGVGQNEIDILDIAHTTIVVLAPGLGDEIQSLKSGILEIGDVFVVNKADMYVADKTERDICAMLTRNSESSGWLPEIFKTVAIKGDGVEMLVQGILRHKNYLASHELLGGNNYSEERLLELLKERIIEQMLHDTRRKKEIGECVKKIRERHLDPYSAVDMLLNGWKSPG